MTTDEHPEAVHLRIPARFLLVPGAALVVGATIGLVRGSRNASLRFLAENAHRPPTTVQGWYFYNKTKNYRVIYGGLKGAGADAAKLTGVALGWVGIEEGLSRAGWGELREVGAGVGVAGVFSGVYRLGWKATGRTLLLGFVVGSSVKGMEWGREWLKEATEARAGGTGGS